MQITPRLVKRARRSAARRGEHLCRTRNGRWLLGSDEIDFESYVLTHGLEQAYGERRRRARAQTIPRLAKGVALDVINDANDERPAGMPAEKYDRIKELAEEAGRQIVAEDAGVIAISVIEGWLDLQTRTGGNTLSARDRSVIQRLIDDMQRPWWWKAP